MRTTVLFALAAVAVGLLTVTQADECHFVTQRVQCDDLTCNRTTHECDICTEDSQCYEASMGCVDHKCIILPLADVFKGETIVAPLLGFLICAIAVVAGIGGGGILVPLYFALLDLPLLNAVALSQATIAGQSFLNLLLLLPRRHPKYSAPNPTRPVINYEYLCLLLPISLVGVMLGNLLSQISPNWLRVVLLYLLLTYILYRVIKKLIAQRREDMEKRALLAEQKEAASKPTSPVGQSNPSVQDEKIAEVEAEQLLPQYPWRWWIFIIFTWGLLFTSNLIRGRILKLMDCGSIPYWIIIAVTCVYNLLFSAGVYAVLKNRRKRMIEGELPDGVIPFLWNVKNTVVFPLISLTAGAAASMFGVGGGLVLSFLLYEVGMVPEEASATSSVCTFLVAVSSAAQFVLQGHLAWDYGLMMFGAGVASTLVGQFGFVRFIRKHGWKFLILGSLAFVIIGSMAALTILGVYNTYETVKENGSLGFGPLCHESPHLANPAGDGFF